MSEYLVRIQLYKDSKPQSERGDDQCGRLHERPACHG